MDNTFHSIGQTLYESNKEEFRAVLEEGYLPNFDRRGLDEEELKSIYKGVGDAALSRDQAVAAKFYDMAGMDHNLGKPVSHYENKSLGNIISDTKTRYTNIMIDGEDASKKLAKIRIRKGLERHAKEYDKLEAVIKGEYSFTDEVDVIEKKFLALMNCKRKERDTFSGEFNHRFRAFSRLVSELGSYAGYLCSDERFKLGKARLSTAFYGTFASYFTGFGIWDLATGNPVGYFMLGIAALDTLWTASSIKDWRKLKNPETYRENFEQLRKVGRELDKYIEYHFDMEVTPKNKDFVPEKKSAPNSEQYEPENLQVQIKEFEDFVKKKTPKKKKKKGWKFWD